MKSCYICGNSLSTKHKSRVKCVCGARYRVLRNVDIINPMKYRASKMERDFPVWICPKCKRKNAIYREGKIQNKCPRCGYIIKKIKNPLLETLSTAVITGAGLAAGFGGASRLMKKI